MRKHHYPRIPEDRTTAINNVHVVTAEETIPAGSVTITGSKIVEIHTGKTTSGDMTINGRGYWLLPGFVDIHGDSLERAIAPRPATPFPLDYVLQAFDAELAVHGITTMFYCVAVAELGQELTKMLRYRETAEKIVKAINRFRPQARVRTGIHLRYEILDVHSLPLIRNLVKQRLIDLVSLMDHTPGFGVFQDIDAYRRYHQRSGGSLQAADDKIEQRLILRRQVDIEAVTKLIHLCHGCNIAVASHDDHTRQKIEWAVRQGIRIAEFPVTRKAAEVARKNGMRTVFGAANLVRGQSHADNLRASDMIKDGLADIICSDYSPMAMLQGLFRAKTENNRSFAEIVRFFSLNPARAVGIDQETGSIEPGKVADIILVKQEASLCRVVATFVGGQPIFLNNAVS